MICENVKVYDLKESLMAAGYPMRTELIDYEQELSEKDRQRAKNLITALVKDNQAHGQFLSGILVSFDVSATVKWYVEMERYKFASFVSSQSTMHRIAKFDFDNAYIEYVDPIIIERMKELLIEYNSNPTPENYLKLLYSNPCGFKLTARMTTNYRCLRNIYKQRKNHRLPEWKEFCKWIETLPASWLITWNCDEEIEDDSVC